MILGFLCYTFWASPLIGFGVGAYLKGVAFARRWWPVPAIYTGVVVACLITQSRSIPLWCGSTLLGPGIGLILAFSGRKTQPDPTACRQCGYNLTGNTSGTCPECGSAAPAAKETA